MNESKVVSLNAVREMKKAEQEEFAFHAEILCMDKAELLNEMVKFQEEQRRAGELSLSMMVRGRILFKALEESAETEMLKTISSSYRRHLELEYSEFMRVKRQES